MLLLTDGILDRLERFAERIVQKLGGEVHTIGEFVGAENFRPPSPSNLESFGRSARNDQLEAVEFRIEWEHLEDAARALRITRISIETKRIPGGLDFDRAIDKRKNAMAFAGTRSAWRRDRR